VLTKRYLMAPILSASNILSYTWAYKIVKEIKNNMTGLLKYPYGSS
jgi:hypothetical protein